MVLVRKRYFRNHCEDLLARDHLRRVTAAQTMAPISRLRHRHVSAARISRPFDSAPLRMTIEDTPRSDSPTAMSHVSGPAPAPLLPKRAVVRARTGQVSLPHPVPLPRPESPHHRDLGGFPFVATIVERCSCYLPARDDRTTVLRREAIVDDSLVQRVADWLPPGLENLVVGRNGRFYSEELEDEELEQIGGVEYRALRFLSYFVAGVSLIGVEGMTEEYMIFCQIVPFAITAIFFSRRPSPAFDTSAGQEASVDPIWNTFFTTASAFTGTGLRYAAALASLMGSLVDQSLVPFAGTYAYVYPIMFAMLVGNHAMPMALRFSIWCYRSLSKSEDTRNTLGFLLDHPRRCFLYLFPRHQTWYLVLVLVAFIVIEIMGYLLLNIGLPVLEDVSSGWQRFTNGLFQSLAVRASGLSIIPVANLAPGTLILYVALMYVAIWPIALSVRSTNVYEEQSLGVFEPEESDVEPELSGQQRTVFG